MFLTIIEPMYTQGVGNYAMVTDNFEHVTKLRKELYNYKNYIRYIENDKELTGWVFYEYIYEITSIIDDDGTFKYYGKELFSQTNEGEYDFQDLVLNELIDDCDNDICYVYDHNKKMCLDMVYNNIDGTVLPSNIEQFKLCNYVSV